MLLKQKRINSISYFSNAKEGSDIFICVDNVERFPLEILKFGFKMEDPIGSTILPFPFNKCAQRNAEKYTTIDKSLPKENYVQTIYWTRTEWAGRGETREVTEFTDICKKRYHRDVHMPFSVCFTLIEDKNGKCIVSDAIKYVQSNQSKLINTVNMLLGLFGECFIVIDEKIKISKTIHLDWEILPKGEYPWDTVKETVKKVCDKGNQTQKAMMLRNCEAISKLSPDFVAYGRAGFRGYIVFGFVNKNLYILESIFPNNATYIFENSWEELSKLTKAEILNQSLHKARIIHNSSWLSSFNEIMEDENE